MLRSFSRAIATLAMIFFAFLTNALSNVVPLNGQSVGEISNTVFRDVLITPANYAFIIWGVIYLAVFTFGFYQVGPGQRNDQRLDPIRSRMMLACGAQVAWIYIFLSRQFVLSLVAMIVIWVALCLGYLKLTQAQPLDRKQVKYIQIPWSIYFGWISVATIVNVALALFSLDWDGGIVSPQAWTVGLMLVAMVLGMIAMWRHRDLAFAGVLIWALVAIAVRHQEIQVLNLTGWGSAIALGLVSAYFWFRPRVQPGA